ncbi:hypothetical protein BH11PSE11_BH11PSE11_33220 [soil metagenome]
MPDDVPELLPLEVSLELPPDVLPNVLPDDVVPDDVARDKVPDAGIELDPADVLGDALDPPRVPPDDPLGVLPALPPDIPLLCAMATLEQSVISAAEMILCMMISSRMN